MRKHIRWIACLVALVLLMPMALPARAESGKKHTTVMVYMCGANLESVNKQGTKSMGDMIASKFNMDEVNVVILAGGSNYWSGGYDTNKLTLLEINGRRPSVVDTFDLASMGEAETLSAFLKLCHENYPAEHYDLVLWDHGGGPNSGVCFDYRYDYDSLSISDLVAGMSDSPFAESPLDLLIFHACLMSSAEVAAAVAPYARYMVAGEDSIYGLSYKWLNGLENDPDPLTTARRVVDYAYEYNGGIIQAQGASELNSFAAIDLSRMQAIVEAMDAFFPEVSVNLNEASFTTMSGQRRGATSFGVGESGPDSDFDLVDLGDLINNYREMAEDKAEALLNLISEAVYCHTDPQNHCMGMTVYHPFSNKAEAGNRLSVYAGLAFSQAYIQYVEQFAELLLGAPMASWEDLETGEPEADKANISKFLLSLNDQQTEHFGDAELFVLLQDEEDTYRLTYVNPQVGYSEGQVSGTFEGTAIYAVDAAGEALSGPLEYTLDEQGNILIPALLEDVGDDGEAFTHEVLIVCAAEGDGKALTPKGLLVREDYLGGYTTVYGTVLEDYETITIPSVARTLTLNERGEILPFDQWEVADVNEGWSAVIDGSWSFAVVNDTLAKEDLYATFQVTDSQNNHYSSTLLCLANDPTVDVQMDFNNDEIETLTLDDPHAMMEGDHLYYSVGVAYAGETEMIANVKNLTVNGAPASDEIAAVVYGSGPNWGMVSGETQPLSLSIDQGQLAPDQERQEITFDLEAVDAQTGEVLGTVKVQVYVNTGYLLAEKA